MTSPVCGRRNLVAIQCPQRALPSVYVYVAWLAIMGCLACVRAHVHDGVLKNIGYYQQLLSIVLLAVVILLLLHEDL